MSLEVNIDPLKALEILYEGETFGIWEGDLIKAERKNLIKLPKILKEYLLKYGELDVNRGSNQLWLPNPDDIRPVKIGDSTEIVYIIGKFHGDLVAIPPNASTADNPKVLFSIPVKAPEPDSLMSFHKSDITLRELLTNIIINSPPVDYTARVQDDRNGLSEALGFLELGKARAEFEKIIRDHKSSKNLLCWNETDNYFIAAVFLEERTIFLKFHPCLSIQELENIFAREFYENSKNCDFKHALAIIERLIRYYEDKDRSNPTLGEKYRLAGRSAWALKDWQKAEDYYQKAEKCYDRELNNILTQVENFYEGLGNFYRDKKDPKKSNAAYDKVDRLCAFTGKNAARLKGNRLMGQALDLMAADQLEQAIELFNQAIEIYRTDPKDCKYDIARCCQLRGEAKRALKPKK